MKRNWKKFAALLLMFAFLLTGRKIMPFVWEKIDGTKTGAYLEEMLSWLEEPDFPEKMKEEIPEWNGEAYVVLNGNQPSFTSEDYERKEMEVYSPLDLHGRCQRAFARIGPETMPKEEREDIRNMTPSGWQNERYDFIDNGGWVYNRCHLIGYQLTAENDNEKNLITGTRYMNVNGMLPFENRTANYVRRTGNHVLYRATPVFEGDNLVCSGVELEALSVEDDGLRFHVYCYNVQPGVSIDYATGKTTED